jgi:hypothetical protein
MRAQGVKKPFLVVICLGVTAAIGVAHHTEYFWVNPCVDDLMCTASAAPEFYALTFPPSAPPGECWCEADWDDPDVWYWVDPCVPGGGCPDHAGDWLIEKSNTRVCSGGADDGEGCSENGHCPGGTCVGTCAGGSHPGQECSEDSDCGFDGTCAQESRLAIFLLTDSIANLLLKTESTDAEQDSLSLKFLPQGECQGSPGVSCHHDSDCGEWGNCVTSAEMLTVASLVLDATAGPLTIKVDPEITLRTSTSD